MINKLPQLRLHKCSAIRLMLMLSFVAIPCSIASAADIYVDNAAGSDAAAGSLDQPVRTIRQGLAIAKPGDTLHLANNPDHPYRESIDLLNRSGEPGKPIVIDGHGSTLTGADPIDPDHWEDLGDGLYRSDSLYQKTSHGKHLTDESINAVVGRYFFLFDRQPQRMDRSPKGNNQPFKQPDQLQSGEWTFIRQSDQEPVFYLRIDPDTKLSDHNIEAPLRSNGVAIYGQRCEHLVIRNITAKHFYNDGVNIHGTTRDIHIENFTAIECGDDGISAHDDCHVEINGFTSIGNSTGMCHVGHSQTTTRNMVIRDCHGVDLYLLNGSRHHIEDSIVLTSGHRAIMIVGGPTESDICDVTLDNVLIVNNDSTDARLRINKFSNVTVNASTINSLDLLASGPSSLTLTNSIWTGATPPTLHVLPEITLKSTGNILNISQLRIADTRYRSPEASAFSAEYESAPFSQWKTVVLNEHGEATDSDSLPVHNVGVNSNTLPTIDHLADYINQ